MRRVGLIEPEVPEISQNTDILGFRRKKAEPEKPEETKKRKPKGTADEVSDI